MSALTIRVYGVAKPQGSAKAFTPKGWTRPIITSDNKGLKAWRELVAGAASEAILAQGWTLPAGAVRIVAEFYLPRPKALGRKARPHVTKPDLDKLARSLGDALTGVAYRDDAQVAQLKLSKSYAAPDESPHAVIVVQSLD